MTSSWYLGDFVAMNWDSESPDNDEDGDLSMRASHSSYLAYCYLWHRQGRVVEYYGIKNLDGRPFVSRERGISGGDGTQRQVKLWVLVVQIFSLTPL